MLTINWTYFRPDQHLSHWVKWLQEHWSWKKALLDNGRQTLNFSNAKRKTNKMFRLIAVAG